MPTESVQADEITRVERHISNGNFYEAGEAIATHPEPARVIIALVTRELEFAGTDEVPRDALYNTLRRLTRVLNKYEEKTPL